MVTAQGAWLWTDGRYHLQASQQIDPDLWTLMKQGPLEKKTKNPRQNSLSPSRNQWSSVSGGMVEQGRGRGRDRDIFTDC